jgi:hypothetical protein
VNIARCESEAGEPTSAYKNYDWELVPLDNTYARTPGRRAPLVSNVDVFMRGSYDIIDVRGRNIHAGAGGVHAANSASLRPARGMYFVVDRTGNLAKRVIVK